MAAELRGHVLEILVCPITRRPLKRIDPNLLDRVNAAIAAGKVRSNGGTVLDEALTAALVTMDGDLVYPVNDGVPVLFENACIHWAAYKNG